METNTNNNTNQVTYYCHGCKGPTHPQLGLPSLVCPTCGSEFVEEVEPSDPPTQFNAFDNNSTNSSTTSSQQPQQPQFQQQQFQQQFHHQQQQHVHHQQQQQQQHFHHANFVFATQLPHQGIHNIMTQLFHNVQGLHPMPFADLVGLVQGGNINDIFGAFNVPMAGNPNDYVMGNMDHLLNHLFQNAQYRGAPPASKSVVEQLKRGTIESTENIGDCAICKDEFEIGVEFIEMPCTHIFHPDCLLPWLDIHNSCPVCRLELKTDDNDYEARRSQQQSRSNNSTH